MFPGGFFPRSFWPRSYYPELGLQTAPVLSSLPFRHQRLFRHRADLWMPIYPVTPDGPQDTVYHLVVQGVPCLFDTKSAIDTPELVGLLESEDLITVDSVRFPEGTVIDSSWIIISRSLDQHGNRALNYGKGWIVKGSPVREESADSIRSFGMVDAYATKLPVLPTGVS